MQFHIDKFCALLITSRAKKGFSQLFMAQRIGVSQKTYSFMEQGRSMPDIIELIKIADLTGVHPMCFIERMYKGEPAWESITCKEAKFVNQIQKLESEIEFLKSQNLFLQKSFGKIEVKTEILSRSFSVNRI